MLGEETKSFSDLEKNNHIVTQLEQVYLEDNQLSAEACNYERLEHIQSYLQLV